jgi:hypothetical protein
LLRSTCAHYSAPGVESEGIYLDNDGEFSWLEGALQVNAELPRWPDKGMAAIWLAWLALWTVSVLSQMAHAQVRLFLVAPTDRHTHLRPPDRKSLCDFDHAKTNCVRRFAIARARSRCTDLKWSW